MMDAAEIWTEHVGVSRVGENPMTLRSTSSEKRAD